MQSRSARSKVFRALGVLAALLLAAGVISPAFGAKAVTKAKVKKVAKKQATNQINTLVPGLINSAIPGQGNPLFIQETEFDRYGPVQLNAGGTQVIGTWAPFTLTAECLDDPDLGGVDTTGRIIITTSENDSTFASLFDADDDFDASGETAADHEWAKTSNGGTAPGTFADPEGPDYDETSHAMAPSGATIWGPASISTNWDGFDCTVAGFVTKVSPS